MKKIHKSTLIIITIALVAGLGLGWLIFRGSGQEPEPHEHDHAAEGEEGTIWTCAMHPQIRQDKPGQCPICGMDLTPLGQTKTDTVADNAYTYQMTAAAAALANVQTTKVTSGNGSAREIVLTGKIEADERRIYEIPAHFHGRLEKLMINFTGEYVSKGEVLASVYSPDLITAQQELFETLPYKESNPAMYRAARNKLKNWKIGDAEIDEIEQSGEVKNELLIRSHQAGVVRKRNVAVGDHVNMGDILFEVVDLSHLWVMFDAYEQHLSWIEVGDQVSFTVASLPGEAFDAKVNFIDPFIDPQTRVAKVRAEVSNSSRKLKPEMFVRGTVRAETASSQGKGLLVPESAVLWTGKRSLVYVKRPDVEQPVFEYREVELGSLAGDYFVVEKGLEAGEEVVTNGTFSIDAAAQLSGKTSMMNPEGGAAPSMPGMKMDDESGSSDASREQPEPTMGAYMEVKDALVADDPAAARKAANKALKNLPDKLGKPAETALNGIAQTGQIEEQRTFFTSLSEHLYKLIKNNNTGSRTLYWNFCPMASDNRGAYWLSYEKNIRNPYMGQKMLTCGEVKERL